MRSRPPKFRHFTTLRTRLPADQCLTCLQDALDEETPHSFMTRIAAKWVAGTLDGYQFDLHRQRSGWWRHDFAAHFYGDFLDGDSATVVEGYFDLPKYPKVFFRIWLAFSVLVLLTIVIAALSMMSDGSFTKGLRELGGIVFIAPFILFGWFGSELALWFSQGDEEFIIEFLCKALDAEVVNGTSE